MTGNPREALLGLAGLGEGVLRHPLLGGLRGGSEVGKAAVGGWLPLQARKEAAILPPLNDSSVWRPHFHLISG